jgi:hypothetical protein
VIIMAATSGRITVLSSQKRPARHSEVARYCAGRPTWSQTSTRIFYLSVFTMQVNGAIVPFFAVPPLAKVAIDLDRIKPDHSRVVR